MRYPVIVGLLLLVLMLPITAEASAFQWGVHISRQEDGTTSGEFVFDNKVIWKLQIVADGAWPVSGSTGTSGTLISPDIINGMFIIKVHCFNSLPNSLECYTITREKDKWRELSNVAATIPGAVCS